MAQGGVQVLGRCTAIATEVAILRNGTGRLKSSADTKSSEASDSGCSWSDWCGRAAAESEAAGCRDRRGVRYGRVGCGMRGRERGKGGGEGEGGEVWSARGSEGVWVVVDWGWGEWLLMCDLSAGFRRTAEGMV